MDLFGIKEHDEQHATMERQLRRLVEQVAQLSIDVGVTRTELRALRLQVDGKVTAGEVDPAIVALNDGLSDARAKLEAAQDAADENWSAMNDDLSAAVADFQKSFDDLEG